MLTYDDEAGAVAGSFDAQHVCNTLWAAAALGLTAALAPTRWARVALKKNA